MATRQQSQLLTLRVLSGKLLAAPDTAFLLHNVYEDTEDGTLTSVPGLQSYTNENDFYGEDIGSGWVTQTTLKAEVYWSIFHTILPNGFDCVLIHADSYIFKYEGALNAWYRITDKFVFNDDSSKYNTQWVATPNGVIIIPPVGRALFYDGEVCGYLGYNFIPKAPDGLGPRSRHAVDKLYPNSEYPSAGTSPEESLYGVNASIEPYMNSQGYAHDALYNFSTGFAPDFGVCRVGTAITPPGIWSAQGKLLKGSYQVTCQFVDRWGNLSPISAKSNAIVFDEQFSWYGTLTEDAGDVIPDKGIPATADRVKKQIIWTNIPKGPDDTIGRILYRTKDTYNSGDLGLYELVGNASGGTNSYATLPDNMSTIFPDNIPDAWLVSPVLNIVPVPEFRFAVIAFGRLWVGNTRENKGLIRPSLEGLWGTFPANQEIIPDPRGYEVTGLITLNGLLVVFTLNSMFLIQSNVDGNGFISSTLSNNIGCIAPNSIVAMPNNTLIWLSNNGFYSFDGKKIIKISNEIDYFVNRVNVGRVSKSVATYVTGYSSYICYAPFESNEYNSSSFCFNGSTWYSQAQMNVVRGLCETQDHRKYLLACGLENKTEDEENNVFVLNTRKGDAQNTRIETSWINLIQPQSGALQSIYILLRDTLYQRSAKAYIMEDDILNDYILKLIYYTDMDMWQKGEYKFRVSDPLSQQYYFDKDIELDSVMFEMRPQTPIYKRSRLFWLRLDINTVQSSCFKLAFQTNKFLKFMGISFNEIPTGDGLTSLPVVETIGHTT